jgi:polyhydroxyalkanoate synthesis regulator phasin
MDPKMMAKQIMDFNKTAFDNTFNAMTLLQDQMEKMMNFYLEQNKFFPEEGKKAIAEWIKAFKRAREDFKNSVEENYKKVESFFAGTAK